MAWNYWGERGLFSIRLSKTWFFWIHDEGSLLSFIQAFRNQGMKLSSPVLSKNPICNFSGSIIGNCRLLVWKHYGSFISKVAPSKIRFYLASTLRPQEKLNWETQTPFMLKILLWICALYLEAYLMVVSAGWSSAKTFTFLCFWSPSQRLPCCRPAGCVCLRGTGL